MRRGEVLDLRWRDIDLESNIIHIRKQGWHAVGTTGCA